MEVFFISYNGQPKANQLTLKTKYNDSATTLIERIKVQGQTGKIIRSEINNRT